MSTRALALVAALAAAAPAQAQDLSLELKGGGVGQTLNVILDGGPGEGYLLLMSTQWKSTNLPAPHVSPIDVGLELLGPSMTVPGFVGLTPANLVYPIPEDPTLDGVNLNFQALRVNGPVLDAKSNPWRLTFSDPETWHESLEDSQLSRGLLTATPLADGTVLLAGGTPSILTPYSGGSAWFTTTPGASTAELYHPGLEAFEVLPNMTQGRARHVATTLADGRVLITGGSNGIQSLASAESYDPQTKSFAATGSMAQGRIGHTATLLPDGRVLVAGGSTVGTHQLAIAQNALMTTELFDPQTGQFTAGPTMFYPRTFHTADLVPDGRVVFAGGFSNSNGSVFTTSSIMTWVPDGPDGKFLNLTSLQKPRACHASLVQADGRVMLIGGIELNEAQLTTTTGVIATKSVERIDPTIPNSLHVHSVGKEVMFPHVAVFDNNDFVVAGGQYGTGVYDAPLDMVSLYRANIGNGGFFHTGHLTRNRNGGVAAALPDGTAALFHGFTWQKTFLKDAEIYQPKQ